MDNLCSSKEGLAKAFSKDRQKFTFRQFGNFWILTTRSCGCLDGAAHIAEYLVSMETGMRALTDEEINRMLAAMTGGKNAVRNQALFQLGIFTGFRISELLSIKVGDVWDGWRIKDRFTVQKGFVKGKKESRTMPINDAAGLGIRRWLRSSKRDNQYFLNWPLFAAQGKRKAISRQLATRVLVEAAERAGIDSQKIGGHSLRKTFATKAWNSQFVAGDMARMAKLLGHKNWSNTLRYISFLDGSLDRAVMEMKLS